LEGQRTHKSESANKKSKELRSQHGILVLFSPEAMGHARAKLQFYCLCEEKMLIWWFEIGDFLF